MKIPNNNSNFTQSKLENFHSILNNIFFHLCNIVVVVIQFSQRFQSNTYKHARQPATTDYLRKTQFFWSDIFKTAFHKKTHNETPSYEESPVHNESSVEEEELPSFSTEEQPNNQYDFEEIHYQSHTFYKKPDITGGAWYTPDGINWLYCSSDRCWYTPDQINWITDDFGKAWYSLDQIAWFEAPELAQSSNQSFQNIAEEFYQSLPVMAQQAINGVYESVVYSMQGVCKILPVAAQVIYESVPILLQETIGGTYKLLPTRAQEFCQSFPETAQSFYDSLPSEMQQTVEYAGNICWEIGNQINNNIKYFIYGNGI